MFLTLLFGFILLYFFFAFLFNNDLQLITTTLLTNYIFFNIFIFAFLTIQYIIFLLLFYSNSKLNLIIFLLLLITCYIVFIVMTLPFTC